MRGVSRDFCEFLQAYRGFHFERTHYYGDFHDHLFIKSKVTVFVLSPFFCVYSVCGSYCCNGAALEEDGVGEFALF